MFLTVIFQDLKPSNIAVNEDCELKVIYGHFPCFWDREHVGGKSNGTICAVYIVICITLNAKLSMI